TASRPDRTASSMLARSLPQPGLSAVGSPPATRAANSQQERIAGSDHCTDVCAALNLATSTDAPQVAQHTGASPSKRGSVRMTRSLSLLGPGEVLGDLRFPLRDRPCGVDLELVPRDHVRLHVRDVHVELLVPAPQLVHRPVLGAEQRVVHPRLVQPDLDVLTETEPDEIGE